MVLSNAAGAEVHVWPVGAAIQKLLVPDRFGRLADVVLGFDDPVQYQVRRGQYEIAVGACLVGASAWEMAADML